MKKPRPATKARPWVERTAVRTAAGREGLPHTFGFMRVDKAGAAPNAARELWERPDGRLFTIGKGLPILLTTDNVWHGLVPA